MVRPMSKLSEVHIEKQTWRVTVRVTSMWNMYCTHYNRVQSIKMILMDEEGSKVQATIQGIHVDKFRHLLKEGKTYILSNFAPQNEEGEYRVSNHPCRLLFLRTTDVQEVELPHFPEYCFTFADYREIIDGSIREDVLVDVIGAVFTVEHIGPKNVKDRTIQMVQVLLQDQKKRIISCTLWGDFATQFISYQREHPAELIVIILTYAKIKDTKGGQYTPGVQNSRYTSRLYINVDIIEMKQFKESLDVFHESLSKQYSQMPQSLGMLSKENFFRRAQVLSLSELTNLRQDSYCITVATISMIFVGNGWFFFSCTNCRKKTKPVPESARYLCDNCGKTNSHAEARYRVEVKVHEGGCSAKFVLWDRECVQMLKVPTTKLIQQFQQEGISLDLLPVTLDELVARRCVFKVRAPANFNQYSVIAVSEDKSFMDYAFEQISGHQVVLGASKSQEDSMGFLTPAKRVGTQSTDDESIILSSAEQSTSKSKKHCMHLE